jgi:hypothetical protein
MALSGPSGQAYDPRTIRSLGAFPMNEEAFNMSLRKFLKVVGVTSQQEIEKAVRAAVANGTLAGNETLTAKVVLTIDQADLKHTVDGTIDLG